MNRFTMIISGLLTIWAVWCAESSVKANESQPPSILVLLADDVDAKDYGCYGNEAIRTPNIDALAADGLRCTNAFLTTPQCSPTRISVLTGKYPHATGAEDLHMPLPEDELLVPSYLKQQGYFCGHMQKKHYGPNGDKQFDWYSRNLGDLGKFLDKCGERPFFMWVGFSDAHRPYKPGAVDPPHDPQSVQVPPFLVDDEATREDLALYYDEISRMDKAIGQFIEELQRRELAENTLVVFFGDNGRPFPRCKGTLYDSGIGTPLIFTWPRVIEPGTVYEGLVSVVDLAPTFLEIAGVPPVSVMQGASIDGLLHEASAAPRQYVFAERNWHNGDEHMRCVRSKQYKLIHNAYLDLPHGSPSDVSGSPSWQSLSALHAKGLLNPAQAGLFRKPRPEYELYDIVQDPNELVNLADNGATRAIRQELIGALGIWQENTGDFPPSKRRRPDNVDRYTGVKFQRRPPEMLPDE